ncbi:hypothetical protein LWI28_026691 [Acer negundo]|uniref:Uncharacterized protein n=1 Tax=Acer negundo TaxID=4023 RepID=A0AAD5P3A7_ACENE|nr:hypothetical protein LWI28_026691 [Acer negundo]
MVGPNGTQLSDGQKQRLAIARAILKNPRILLLDEATSALDAESERIVQHALENVMTNRTTVVVAHRLTTIRNADIIPVVHKGKLVEQGNHEELIKDPEGAYSQLVRLQDGAKNARVTNSGKSELNSYIMAKSRSQSLFMRSGSKGSSRSSRQSFGLISISVPGTINFFETEAGADDQEKTTSEWTTEIDIEKRNQVSMRRLAYLNKPELPILLIGSVAAMIHAVPCQNYFFGMAGGKLIQRIRSLTFDKVVHQQITWFDDPANYSGAVGARLSTDASTIKSVVGDALALIVQNISTIITGLLIAFTANWILALVILAISPLMILQGNLQAKFLKGFSADAKLMYEEASQVATDAVGNMRTVASFCAEKKMMDLYHNKCEDPMKQGVRRGLVSGAGFGFSFFVLYCTNAFTFYIGSLLVKGGKATAAEVFKVFFAFSITAIGVSQATSMAPDTNKARDSAASILDILDSKPEIDSSSNEGTKLSNVRGDIGLEHVSFKYPHRPDVQIFKDLCLSIPSGKKQRIAIARAILKNPKILLLDEATSALDAESERIVQDALDTVMVNRTTVVVAHRLATIRNADIIAVVKNGVIAEKGTHDALMKINNGAYASLVALQSNSS